MINEVVSPTLPDLSIRVNADYSEIGRAISFKVIGCFFTPLISGLLYDRFPRLREVGIGVIFVILGLFSVATPYCRSVWVLTVVLISQGLADGFVVTAAQSMIIELFSAQAVAALQFMHLGWGLGSFLANLIVRPFLAPNLKLSRKSVRYACLDNENSTLTLFQSDTNSTTIGNFTLIEKLDNSGSQIEYAYIIIGSYTCLIGIILFIFSFFRKPVTNDQVDSNAHKKKSMREMLAPSFISDGKPAFGTLMLVCLFLIYMINVGSYGTFSRYLVTIAMDPCKGFEMTQKSATTLQSVKAIAFSFSRIFSGILLAILTAHMKHPGYFILSATLTSTISVLLLDFVGLRFELAFWILTCTYSFFHSPLFGGVTPWFNRYIRATSSVVAVAMTGMNVGKFIFTWLGGYVLKAHSSTALMHIYTALNVCLAIIVLIVTIVSLRTGQRPSFQAKVEKARQPLSSEDASDSQPMVMFDSMDGQPKKNASNA